MDIFIKETLYVLDYDNNIVDMIFTSDDHRTPGYAYNINIDESNMGYSNLTFTMPTRIMAMPNELNEAPASEDLIHNPKLDLLTPLVKLRYLRQTFYMGDEECIVQTPSGYGDTTTYVDVVYQPHSIVDEYVMDYIVQPSDKKRNGYEVSVNFSAIDYPRFNLSKKRFGLTVNDKTITRDAWSLFDSKPMDVAGVVKYIQWNEELSSIYGNAQFPIPTEWDPSTAVSYPLNATQINNMMQAKEEWPYGLSATVYWWPIKETGRFEGRLYEAGDFLTLQIYPKFQTGEIDTSAIETSLDFYGYEWLYLDKGASYLTPNNPCNYLNWVLENTNWEIAINPDRYLAGWIISSRYETTEEMIDGLPNPTWDNYDDIKPEVGDYWMYRCIDHTNSNYLLYGEDYSQNYMGVDSLPILTTEDLGKWASVISEPIEGETKYTSIDIYTWDGSKWYLNYADREYIITRFFQWDGQSWNDVSNEYWTSTVDRRTGIIYDVDVVETEVAKPDSSTGDLFETTDLRTSINLSDSNCYNAITEICKAFQLYPVFNCKDRTVALKLFAGKNYGLTYMLGRSLEGTTIKADGDKVITKLYSYGGQDAKGNEDINLGDAERSYQAPNDNPDEREPWDPNAPEYIQKRSPYGTNYIYNFKWMYDNGWMSKEQILGIYALNEEIQELNKKVLKPLTEDYVATTDAYVNAGVQLSTDQDEYLSVINSMMNTYYRRPGEDTEKFTAFPVAPAGCYEKVANSNIYYLDLYHCHTCGATRGTPTENNDCTTAGCPGKFEIETIHINTWDEEANSVNGRGTTSDQWDPSSKGFFQEVYEQLGVGLREHIYLNQIFVEEDIDYLTTEKKYIINGTTVYDKSSHLYHWNDCINKWIKQYGLTIEDEKRVKELQLRVELLEEARKVYNQELGDLENKVQDRYGNFIIEGKFQDSEIVYPSILLVKTLEASDQYATPEVTYSLNVIDSSGLIEYRLPGSEVYNDLVHSLHSIGQIIPKAGDYVTIYDEPMGLFGVPGLITNIRRVLDNPQSNSITVDTSYTDDEELVGNIITATNTVLSNKDIYARTAVLQADGTISSSAMAKTLEESVGENISFIGVNGSTLLDSTGLLATNPNNPERKMKYTGSGVFGTVDNGVTYDAMMTPEGINANYINAGSIDTRKLQIISGLYSKVVLDNFGLSVKADSSSRYTLPTTQKTIEGEKFLDWKDSNLKAFIGVDAKNNAQLYLNGQMQIEGGSVIGGWNVLGNKLFSTNGTSELTPEQKAKGIQNYVGLSSEGKYAFWTGHQDPEKANFKIQHSGELISETMNAKFKVTNESIETEVKDRKDADSGLSSRIAQTYNSISLSVGNKDKAGSISISMTKDNGETSTSSGLISSIVLTADKVELNGGINKIGGWVIKDDYLGNMAGAQNSSAASQNYFLSQNGKYAWCSMNDAEYTYYLFFKDKFAVRTDGTLFAKGAVITGGSTFKGTLDGADGTFSGSLSAASGSFKGSLDAATGTFNGDISAASGVFKGAVYTVSSEGWWKMGDGVIWGLAGQTVGGDTDNWETTLKPGGVIIYSLSTKTTREKSWWDICGSSSDMRVKNNINVLDDKFENFYNELSPVSFYFNSDYHDDKGKIRFGFIAQEVEEAARQTSIPEVAAIGHSGNPEHLYDLNKEEIIALNTWQIQKLKKEVKALKEELQQLKKEKTY